MAVNDSLWWGHSNDVREVVQFLLFLLHLPLMVTEMCLNIFEALAVMLMFYETFFFPSFSISLNLNFGPILN